MHEGPGPSADEDRPHNPRPAGARDRALRRVLGWCVHFYTALGLVCAAGIAVAIVEGGPAAFRWAFVLMLRRHPHRRHRRHPRPRRAHQGGGAELRRPPARRPHRLPDLHRPAAVPGLARRLLPAGQEAWLLLPLLASAYGFCQVSAKTDDGYFLGFPSYWNLVALYLYLLHSYVFPLPGWLVVGVVVGFALLTFVPTRYLYPSQKGRLNLVTNVFGALWAALLVWVLYRLPVDGSDADEATRWLIVFSLLFPMYYLVVSWAVSVRLSRGHRRKRRRLRQA